MNYELAKSLKDAGFPGEIILETDGEDVWNVAKAPTLEELIEACGGSFGALMVGPGFGLWSAKGSRGITTHADTKEEALARLWVASTLLHDDK